MDLAKKCTEVLAISLAVAEFIQAEQGNLNKEDIEHKELNSLVSYVDVQAEKLLVEGLRTVLSEAGFITEEGSTSFDPTAPYHWVIDPLDGTTNFIHRLPQYSISIALKQNNEYILGVVCDVARKDFYYAWKGGGAFENGVQIKVSENNQLSEALVATGFPYTQFEHLDAYMWVFRHLVQHTRGLRRFGSAALDLVYVARGSYDAFFEQGLNEWDVAAGICIVREAGGKVLDFDGNRHQTHQADQVIACNAQIDEQMMEVMQLWKSRK